MESPIFALLGAAGFVAPRHIEAIYSVDGELCCACDKSDSVGVLDRRFPHCQFFLSENELESYVDERKKSKAPDIDFLSICTPNYLHFSHIAFGLSHGMNVICEKPLVLTSNELFRLQELEKQYGKKVFCILQLRLHPQIQKLKTRVEDLFAGDRQRSKLQVSLNYMTSRGPWYKKSWKFDESKSGGIASNIGIHFFDMLIRLFGYPTSFSIKGNDPERLEGTLDCPLAQIEFCLRKLCKMLDSSQWPLET